MITAAADSRLTQRRRWPPVSLDGDGGLPFNSPMLRRKTQETEPNKRTTPTIKPPTEKPDQTTDRKTRSTTDQKLDQTTDQNPIKPQIKNLIKPLIKRPIKTSDQNTDQNRSNLPIAIRQSKHRITPDRKRKSRTHLFADEDDDAMPGSASRSPIFDLQSPTVMVLPPPVSDDEGGFVLDLRHAQRGCSVLAYQCL